MWLSKVWRKLGIVPRWATWFETRGIGANFDRDFCFLKVGIDGFVRKK
jgi:hypothetical protein